MNFGIGFRFQGVIRFRQGSGLLVYGRVWGLSLSV